MKLTVKKIILDSFKGIPHAEFNLGDTTIISGKNGSGKTTIADAHFWLWTDRDYSLNKNPEIHPDFMEESEPSVTEIIDIDGSEVEVRKIQLDSRTKKQKQEGKPISVKNTYEINGVPKSQSDFVSDMEERGIDFDTFLLLSHIDIFTSYKNEDCRKILFSMVSDVTDLSIAESMENCPEAAEALKNYKTEEVLALQKRTKKQADENLDSIPQQIIGMEKSKINVDVDALNERREAVQSEIDALKDQAKNLPAVDETVIKEAIKAAERGMKRLEDEANADRITALNIANNAVSELEDEKAVIEKRIAQRKSSIDGFLHDRDRNEKRYEVLKKEFQEIKKQQFTAGNCAYCGQPLPDEKVEELRLAFERKQTENKAEINNQGKRVRSEIKAAEAAVHDLSAEVKNLMAQLNVVNAKLSEATEKRGLYTVPVDVSKKPEYKRFKKQIDKCRADLADAEQNAKTAWDINEKLVEKGHAMKVLNDEIAQAAINERIDQQIAEARQMQKHYAQEKANAEKILYQISLISMRKNELLTEQVNSHFSRVKFRLFKYQKNGEVKDDCTPMVLTQNGEYRDMNYSANTAAIKLAQLDIIQGLSEFIGSKLPVLVDGAEAFDAENLAGIQMDDHQAVFLKVAENNLNVEVLK